ncbi:MAG TPA: hypothetical protein VLZ72_10665 [Flavobacterium sp.]|nr:hypothetical protein [Flavobacterium sp.]
MIRTEKFYYKPTDSEAERASNSYLMSLVAVIGGLPLPVLNLLATLFFYLGNRKTPDFVRWHCTQALLAQLGLFCCNSIGFWWTISIIFTDKQITNSYIAYIITVFVFNVLEFVSTIVLASKTRKGLHAKLFLFADITDLIFRKNENPY